MSTEHMPQTPIHPGEILADELQEIGLSAKELADALRVPPGRLYRLLARKSDLTADMALRLSHYLGTSAAFWMNLRTAYQLALAHERHGAQIRKIPVRPAAARFWTITSTETH